MALLCRLAACASLSIVIPMIAQLGNPNRSALVAPKMKLVVSVGTAYHAWEPAAGYGRSCDFPGVICGPYLFIVGQQPPHRSGPDPIRRGASAGGRRKARQVPGVGRFALRSSQQASRRGPLL